MLQQPWKLLVALSGALAGLGLVIVIVAGYSGASVLVPFRCALIVLAGGLLILRFGSEHRLGKPIFYTALGITLLFGLNFGRLGLKWHGSMGWTSIQPIAGLLMGLGCVWVASCLWAARPVTEAATKERKQVGLAWRPLVPAMCALAVIGGVILLRSPSGPQGALADPGIDDMADPPDSADTLGAPNHEDEIDAPDSEVASPD